MCRCRCGRLGLVSCAVLHSSSRLVVLFVGFAHGAWRFAAAGVQTAASFSSSSSSSSSLLLSSPSTNSHTRIAVVCAVMVTLSFSLVSLSSLSPFSPFPSSSFVVVDFPSTKTHGSWGTWNTPSSVEAPGCHSTCRTTPGTAEPFPPTARKTRSESRKWRFQVCACRGLAPAPPSPPPPIHTHTLLFISSSKPSLGAGLSNKGEGGGYGLDALTA